MAERVNKVRLEADVSSYINGMEQAQKHTRQLETAAEELARNGQAFTQFGQAMVVAGGVLTGGTALAAKAAVDWESAWAGVTKTVDGTPEQMAAVEDGLRGLTAVLPASHDEIAAVAEAAGQLGIQAGAVVDFTRVMIDLGETTNLSADEAATSIAQLMNIMQTAPGDVDNLGSALVALGNNGASTERDIIQMAQRIAGAGKTVGLSEDEVLGFSNALASVGIDAEAGGSALSRIMTDMAMDVSTGGEAIQKWAEVAGMSAQEFATAFKEDPADAIATFVEGLGRIDSAGGDVFATLKDLGQSDVRTSQALLGMANSGDVLRKSLEQGADAWEENNALQDEAAKRYETTAAKVDIAKNAVVDAAIGFGEVFLPAVQGVADVVTDVSQAFGDLPQPAKDATSALVGLMGITALSGGAFLLALPKIADYRSALITLSSSSIPGVSAAAGGMLRSTRAAGRGLANLAKFMTGPWGVALLAGGIAVKGLSDYLDGLKATTEQYQNAIKTLGSSDSKSSVKGVSEALFDLAGQGVPIETLDKALEDLGGSLDRIGESQGNVWMDFIEPREIERLKTVLGDLGKQLAETAGTDLPAAQAAFKDIADSYGLNADQMGILLDSMPEYKEALLAQATAQGIQVEGLSDAEKAQVLLNLAQGDAKPVTKDATDEYKDQASKVAALKKELDGLIDSLNEANGVGQDAVSQNINYQETLADVAEHIKNIQDGVEGYSTGIDANTEAGRANLEMLNGLAEDSQSAAEATYKQNLETMSASDATAIYVEQLKEGRQKLIDSAMAAGVSEEAAKDLADQIYKVPTERETKFLADTAEAQQQIDWYMQHYGTRVGTIIYRAQLPDTNGDASGNGKMGTFADGGMETYANAVGNMYDFQTGIYAGRAGAIHKFAEPETGWEAYISGRPGKEGRNIGIAYEALARLGALPQPQVIMAGGGGQSGSAPLIQGDVNISSRTVSGALNDLNFELRKRARGGR